MPPLPQRGTACVLTELSQQKVRALFVTIILFSCVWYCQGHVGPIPLELLSLHPPLAYCQEPSKVCRCRFDICMGKTPWALHLR